MTQNYTTQLLNPLLSKTPLNELYAPPAFFYTIPRDDGYFSEIEAMLLDSQVQAALCLRKRMALSFPRILTGDPEAKDIVSLALSEITWSQDMEDFLSCLEYGYSVHEIIWQIKNGKWLIKSIEPRDPRNFRFNKKGELVFKQGNKWVPAPERKFLVFRNRATAENPYGKSVLVSCYPAWKAKLSVLRYLVRLADKYSIPSVIALTEASNESEIKEISNILSTLESASGVALSGVSQIITLSAQGKASELIESIKYLNDEITKAITGQVLALDKGDTGSYAQSKVHQESLRFMALQDIENIVIKLNRTLIRWILELNSIDMQAKITINSGPIPTLRDYLDVFNAGIPISKQNFYENTGILPPKDALDTLERQKEQISLSDKPDTLLIQI